MPIETTIEEAELSLAAPAETYPPSAGWIHSGWVLGQLVLTGLLLTYLVAWAHDFQRIRQLEAEPTPPSKVITKNQAWQRIYSRAARKIWQASAP